jgi:hypothetical protein
MLVALLIGMMALVVLARVRDAVTYGFTSALAPPQRVYSRNAEPFLFWLKVVVEATAGTLLLLIALAALLWGVVQMREGTPLSTSLLCNLPWWAVALGFVAIAPFALLNVLDRR